jgi:hypothetical protein
MKKPLATTRFDFKKQVSAPKSRFPCRKAGFRAVKHGGTSNAGVDR